jgi:hypothetical protein
MNSRRVSATNTKLIALQYLQQTLRSLSRSLSRVSVYTYLKSHALSRCTRCTRYAALGESKPASLYKSTSLENSCPPLLHVVSIRTRWAASLFLSFLSFFFTYSFRAKNIAFIESFNSILRHVARFNIYSIWPTVLCKIRVHIILCNIYSFKRCKFRVILLCRAICTSNRLSRNVNW